jgi:2-C-methyl-D-erythritol 2,4-cyclodiphosphate synthase
VQIVEEDFPQVREVDMKLIELAKVYDCKIVTNDFNLNKVAQLHGVEVLNINELANSLKPIVLPGETMRVFILKEGKEYNQGVAYLDDGTMVVVDNAKKMISKTIDISVTSVLQTTAGKMIFGKFDERMHAAAAGPNGTTARCARAIRSRSRRIGRENHDRIVEHMKVAVILPAAGWAPVWAGAAEKTGTSRKQFMLLEGSPILLHTVRKFAASPRQRDRGGGARRRRGVGGAHAPARGFPAACAWWKAATAASNRWRTRFAALDPDTDLVAVHDAVRPFIDLETIDKVIDEAAETGAAIVGIVPVDTVKQVSARTSNDAQDPRHPAARETGAGADAAGVPLRPAGARLRSARATASSAPTNPAWWSGWIRWKSAWCWAATATSKSPSPATWTGAPVLRRGNAPRKRAVSEYRTGQGWDVHRLAAGRPLILGGVTVPSEFGLEGHSDADVLAHAITDAILGAGRAGRYRHAFPGYRSPLEGRRQPGVSAPCPATGGAAGFRIVNVDSTVILERPKLKDYREAIRQRLAETLGLDWTASR